jgi:predicted GNAT superfamily acetyltransferase
VVEVPAGAPALYAKDPKAARRARLDLRRVAEALFARGFAATAVEPGPERALYRFER